MVVSPTARSSDGDPLGQSLGRAVGFRLVHRPHAIGNCRGVADIRGARLVDRSRRTDCRGPARRRRGGELRLRRSPRAVRTVGAATAPGAGGRCHGALLPQSPGLVRARPRRADRVAGGAQDLVRATDRHGCHECAVRSGNGGLFGASRRPVAADQDAARRCARCRGLGPSTGLAAGGADRARARRGLCGPCRIRGIASHCRRGSVRGSLSAARDHTHTVFHDQRAEPQRPDACCQSRHQRRHARVRRRAALGRHSRDADPGCVPPDHWPMGSIHCRPVRHGSQHPVRIQDRRTPPLV